MKAVVLVGGEGTRLRPLTETIPKPLVHFMNRPFIDHVLDHLGGHGVEEVILSSSYLEEEFHSYLHERRGPPSVTWITEPQPLGTSGAIVGARDHLDDTFLVLNGDVLTDLDLEALVAFHRDRGAIATIALTPVDDARPYGLVETEPDGRVLAFREKPSQLVPGTINAGTYVLEPRALEKVPAREEVSIERQTFPSLIEGGEPVYALVSHAYWRDLGTPEAYIQAHIDAMEGLVAPYRGSAGPLVDERAVVHPEAVLGPHVVVGEGTRVGPGASIDRSVLQRDVVVEEGATVEGSILGPASRVGAGARVRNAVLAEGARVAGGAALDGLGVRPGQVAAASAG
ncbi:MAG: sugar phosphate nucleotidyltransferase [Actinomycetota bacterium]